MGVITISADYGAHSDGATKTTTGNIFVGSFSPIRGAIRFSLSSAPSGLPTKAELIVNTAVQSGGTSQITVRAYNNNGQADPSGDNAATLYSRANGTAYVSNSTGFRGLGLHTIDITAGSILADIQAAKGAVGRFTLGLTDAVSAISTGLTPDEDGTNPPKLRLTYPDSDPGAGLFWGWV